MVSVAKYHSLHFVNNRISPYGIASGNAPSADGVTFQSAFVHNLETGSVAKLIEERIITIVRSAERIYVSAFHYVEILIISLLRNRPTVIRVEIVTVYTANHQRLAVKENFFSYYLNLFETETD